MGSFLQSISQIHHQEPSFFYQKIASVSQSIDKIKEYYGLFKSVCDSFLITKDKYLEIFQTAKNLEEIWDREKLNKIDALQLFSGLIAFSSQSSFRQKLKFWFVMFDFNEIKNVSFVDVEYLTLCICNATFKILGKNAKANENEIVNWLKGNFSEKQRINITKLYAFCVQSQEVKRFFELVTKEGASNTANSGNVNAVGLKDFHEAERSIKSLNLPLSHSLPYYRQNKKELQDKLQWHRQFSKKISTPYNPTTYLHSTNISWVYGMAVQNLQRPFLLISPNQPSVQSTLHQQQLLYSTSTIMVLYNPKTNKQRYYRGHTRLVSSFLYNKSKRMVVSAADSLCSRSVHVWSYHSLQCLKVLDTYKPVKSMALLGKNQEMLVVVCGEVHTNQIPSHNKNDRKSTIMIFSLQEQMNYSLIYSYTFEHVIRQIVRIETIIDEQEVMINIWNSFIVVCEDSASVIFCEFEVDLQKDSNGIIHTSANLKTLSYEFYEEPDSVLHKNPNQTNSQHHEPQSKTNITCCIALYLNEENPSLRSFISNQESLSLCIITGHANGQIKCVFYNEGQFSSEDVIYQELGMATSHKIHSTKPAIQVNRPPHLSSHPHNHPSTQQHEHSARQSPEQSITCISHTQSHIIFSHASFITVVPFSFIINKEPSHMRRINILDYHELRLFNSHIRYFAHSPTQILLVTEKEGDFVSIQSREILFNDLSFAEKESVRKIKTLTKIESNVNSTMCLLEKVESEHLVYLTTQDRKILIINSFSKEVENVWEINSPGDHITAIDAVYTDEDVLYFVCGCKEGKLYIRVDNEENPKFYDCVSEIIDIKISKDASYLLVATVEKYLYFFTQINKNFSSPRKLHFQNEIPVCMNFLDSNKMFTVNTSAKNVYMIEIPQLKHRNVQKESERINISKMKIMYPSTVAAIGNGSVGKAGGDGGSGSKNSSIGNTSGGNNPMNTPAGSSSTKKNPPKGSSPYTHQSQRSLLYTKTYLGGQLKYFLMTLHNGQLLFFQNRFHLTNLSYVHLAAHWSEISSISIVEGQDQFYTLGRYDNTLIEWSTQSTRTLTNVPQSVRLYSEKVSAFEVEEFERMKEISWYYKLVNGSRADDIYLFKGTKNEKLNEALRKSLGYLAKDNAQSGDRQLNEDDDQIVEDANSKVMGENPNNKANTTTNDLLPYMPRYKLNMRQPNLALDMSYIYGLQCYKRSSVVFWTDTPTNRNYKDDTEDNEKVLYHSSRFLLSLDIAGQNRKKQTVLEEKRHKISCFVVTHDQKILYALSEPNNRIHIHGEDRSLPTTHQLGIIHISTFKHYLLSYGLLKASFSINLHNYKTGQLLMKRTTELKIHEFIFINRQELVSLNEIRIWKDLYPSEKIGKATAGILMPNGCDVCLGTDNGSISILNTQKGVFTIVTKAHESDITCITINKLEPNSFQVLTVSKDDKIKIWNQKFNCKLMINLREELLKNVKFLVETQDQRRNYNTNVGLQSLGGKEGLVGKQSAHNSYRSLNIRGIDSRKGKILVYLASGEVYVGKFTLINRENRVDRSVMEDDSEVRYSQQENSLVEQSNESIFLQLQKNNHPRKDNGDYQKQWQKVIESHSCETTSMFRKFMSFTVHPEHPIIASVGGNDKKLLFRNYQTSQVVDCYQSEEARISCLRFSKRGKLLVLGFRNGSVKVYSFEVVVKDGLVRGISMRFSQKFPMKEQLTCQPLNIEFSQRSSYFSVSFIGHQVRQQPRKDQSLEQPTQNQSQLSTVSFVQIYKQKHQYSQQSAMSEETFYSLIDTVHIKEDDSSLFASNRYVRCVYHMTFVASARDEGMGGGKDKDKNKEKEREKELRQSKDPKPASQNPSTTPTNNICLVMYEQYVNENKIRLNHSQKDKFIVYIIEEKSFAKKEFEQVDWSLVAFPQLVNVLQLNRFSNEVLFLNDGKQGEGEGNKNAMNGLGNDDEGQQSPFNEPQLQPSRFDDNPLSITSMCYYKRDFIIYGGTHGKLHLTRLSSLLPAPANDPLQELRQQQMSITKTYVAQTSFISHLQLTSDCRYLFVAGQLDESIIKYRVQQLSPQCELDYQLYDTHHNTVAETYVTKEKFYNFINSIMPLREEIRNLLEDVEGFDRKDRGRSEGDEGDGVGLEVIKVVGRRAYDRGNNVCMSHESLIYTIGPNLVIQNIMDPFQQTTLPSDPHPLSYSPQISTIHMKPNTNILILSTQEQASRLFVWDIRASICLSEMQVNCSVIYSIKLVGDRYAVFYGVNAMFQLVVQVVDWKRKRVVALCNLMHSATWKIRDLCAIELPQSSIIEESSIRFITCGIQHLSQWTIRSNTLIETHFTNIPQNSSFLVANHYRGEYIITGCERGLLYLWKNRCMLQNIKVHTGSIRSIEVIVETNTIISGGLDSVVYVSKLEEEEIYVEGSKSLNPKIDDVTNNSNIEESQRGDKQPPSQQQPPSSSTPTTFLTEFDIQSLIYSPLIDTTKNHKSSPLLQECNFFAGTRSGDIYFCEYNLKEKDFISISQVVYGQDHETIVCTAFSDREEVLYTLTTSGKLEVWDLKVFEKVFSYKFMKKTKKLYVYKEYLLICFQKQVIFIELDTRDKIIKIDESLTLNFDGTISECILSFNQAYLAIGLHQNESNEILIYQIDKKNLIYHSPSLKYEIEFLDFSTDEKYLLYKDKFEEIGMVYLVTLKRINTIFVEMKIQWQTEGLRISPKAQRIYCSYNCENRITTICKLNAGYILVGDQMGTLRIFPYPPDNDRLGELHTNCYTQHMNKINSIKQHKELTYLATTSVYDRSLIVWRKYGLG